MADQSSDAHDLPSLLLVAKCCCQRILWFVTMSQVAWGRFGQTWCIRTLAQHPNNWSVPIPGLFPRDRLQEIKSLLFCVVSAVLGVTALTCHSPRGPARWENGCWSSLEPRLLGTPNRNAGKMLLSCFSIWAGLNGGKKKRCLWCETSKAVESALFSSSGLSQADGGDSGEGGSSSERHDEKLERVTDRPPPTWSAGTGRVQLSQA